jgi:hypothetical protein
VKISQELSNKDRVMKSQLEEKDREIKRLKSLGEKVEKGRQLNPRESLLAQRRAHGNGNENFPQRKGLVSKSSLAAASGAGGDQLSNEQITHLQGWLTREIDDQAWRVTLAEEIKIQNEERAVVNKKLAHLKQLRDKESSACSATIASRSEEEIQREGEIKHLEVSFTPPLPSLSLTASPRAAAGGDEILRHRDC